MLTRLLVLLLACSAGHCWYYGSTSLHNVCGSLPPGGFVATGTVSYWSNSPEASILPPYCKTTVVVIPPGVECGQYYRATPLFFVDGAPNACVPNVNGSRSAIISPDTSVTIFSDTACDVHSVEVKIPANSCITYGGQKLRVLTNCANGKPTRTEYTFKAYQQWERGSDNTSIILTNTARKPYQITTLNHFARAQGSNAFAKLPLTTKAFAYLSVSEAGKEQSCSVSWYAPFYGLCDLFESVYWSQSNTKNCKAGELALESNSWTGFEALACLDNSTGLPTSLQFAFPSGGDPSEPNVFAVTFTSINSFDDAMPPVWKTCEPLEQPQTDGATRASPTIFILSLLSVLGFFWLLQ